MDNPQCKCQEDTTVLDWEVVLEAMHQHYLLIHLNMDKEL